MALRLIIAIPSHNRPDALKTLLAQLDAQADAPAFEVYVLNDGGNQESARLLETFSPRLYRLQMRATGAPSGLPRARNIMLDWIADGWAREPLLVCFLDDDCEVNTIFVQEIMRAARRFEAFTFRIETVGQSGIVNTRGNRFLSWLLRPLRGHVWLPLGVIRGGYYEWTPRPVRVDHLPGGCLIYRFDRYPRLRFDELLNDGNAILEDTDFSCALRTAGARLRYIGSYGIVHRPGGAGGVRVRTPREKYFYYWKHKWYLVQKWAGRRWYPLAFCVGLLECFLLLVMTRRWFGRELWRSWSAAVRRAWVPTRIADGMRICSPMSGVNSLSILGGEVYDAELLASLTMQGVAVELVLPHGRRMRDHGGTSWQLTTMQPYRTAFGYYWSLTRAVARAYRERPFAVLRLHSPYMMALPLYLWSRFHRDVRVWAHYHHVEGGVVAQLITRFFARRWNVVTASSEATRQELITKHGVSPVRSRVVYPGIRQDIVGFIDGERLRALRKERGLDDVFLLLHVGSLIPRKDIGFLIDLLPYLPDRAVLVVVGRGPEQARLERQAVTLRVRHRVAFVGAVSTIEKYCWLMASDLLMLSSRREGFGMVVAEAALCGTPAVVSDLSALREVVQDGVTGRVCPTSIEVWREVVEELMEYPEERTRLGVAAARMMRDRFTWRRSAAVARAHITAFCHSEGRWPSARSI